ncbi:MAG: DUF2298 domain-containing protein [Oscillochloridaceae bacterium umkhey_bin13]
MGGFVALGLVRAINPDLWHPIWGGEKPMEFGFLNAVLRSPVMPPYDPFFSDGYINYYYYGYFLVSLPIKLTGIAPAVGFNLAVVTLFALTLAGAFAIGAELTRRVRYGLLAAALVTLVGNLAGFFAVGWSRGFPAVLEALRGGLIGVGERLGDWYIGPSRVIPYTINEFPYFTFLFADLHPHMIALPIALLVVALAYCVVQAEAKAFRLSPATGATMLLLALSLGALAVTNSWDFPTYGLLTGLALIGAAWRVGRGRTAWATRLGASLGAALLALGLGLAALALYAPFFDRYWAPVGGIGLVPWSDGTTPGDYLILYGLFLAVLFPVLVGGLWRVVGPVNTEPPLGLVLRHRPEPPAPWLAAGSLVALMLLALFVPDLGLRLVLVVLLLAGLILLARRTLGSATWYGLLLAWVAWAVSLGIELIYIRDHLAGGDWYRMNTVFKFGLHIWVLLALAAAISLPSLLRGLRRAGGTTLQGAVLGMLALLLALAAFYPLAATPSRIANRFPVQTGPTLDGIAFMDQASFSYDCAAFGGCMPGMGVVPIDLSGDAEAIRWLNANLQGTPVIVQSNLSFYRGYGIRIAANTGFPTVVSALHVNEQRDPAAAARRDRAVERFFRDPDLEQALRFLATYQVAYVYVGAIERAIYPPEGLAKFEQLSGSYLAPVFEHPLTTIYAVRGVPPSYARPLPYDFSGTPARPVNPPPDPDLVPDNNLAAIETAQRANPTNGPLAFGLAERYRDLGRLDEAAAILEPAARTNPNDLGVLHLWGDILAEAGRYREAEEAYLLAAQADPSAGNWNKLGAALLDWGAYDKAELALTRAITTDPISPDPYYHLGRLFVLQGQPARALEALNTYLSLAPDGQWANAARQLRAEVLP